MRASPERSRSCRRSQYQQKAIRGSSGETAMYVVQFRHDGDDLAEPMADIRTWLDHQHIQPSVFRLSLISGATIFRLEFKGASDAETFAEAFDGQVIRDERSAVAA